MPVSIQLRVVPAAGGWLDDAASGLDAGPVYVSPQVSDAASLQQTLQQVVPQDGSIGVAVLPQNADLESAYSTYLLDQLFAGSDYDTLVVSIGGDLQADSHALDGDAAMRIANEAETAAGGDLQTALTETVRQIADEAPIHSGPGGDGGAGAAWILPVGIAVVVAAAGAAIVTMLVRRRRRTRERPTAIPTAIQQRLDRLTVLGRDYAQLGAQGNPVAAQTGAEIQTLVSHVGQLFPRLDAKAAASQRTLAEVEYSDKLARLVAALDHDYLYDLLVNPQLWEDPTERIAETREALQAVSAQVLENIKQVNARKGLHFQVSLDSLVGREELRDWEREFQRSLGQTDTGTNPTV